MRNRVAATIITVVAAFAVAVSVAGPADAATKKKTRKVTATYEAAVVLPALVVPAPTSAAQPTVTVRGYCIIGSTESKLDAVLDVEFPAGAQLPTTMTLVLRQDGQLVDVVPVNVAGASMTVNLHSATGVALTADGFSIEGIA